MLHFTIITIFPEMFTALNCGIAGRAQKHGLITINCLDLREFSDNSYRRVDERPYGGGPGMVMMYAPLKRAIAHAKTLSTVPAKVIYLSPQGKVLKQDDLRKIAASEVYKNLVFIAGRYEGIDERLVVTEVDEEWSIGDYILSGGELPAMVIIDTLTRLLPGALGDPESAEQDSFSADLLDHPHYTRPEIIDDKPVPEILLSGNHKDIAMWRLKQALGRTYLRRPELLQQKKLTRQETDLLREFIDEQ